MKKISIFIPVLLIACFLCSLYSCVNNNNRYTQEQADSIAASNEKDEREAKRIQDSIDKANKELAAKLEKVFTTKFDEFTERTWVYPPTKAKYRNRNATYCYFQKDGDKATNFRFVLQYEDDDWLFIRSLIINVDGKNHEYNDLKFETDCGYGGRIWEWCDLSMSDESLIEDLSTAKSVKIKMIGRQYHQIRTLTNKEVDAIRNTIAYYKALGGSFE